MKYLNSWVLDVRRSFAARRLFAFQSADFPYTVPNFIGMIERLVELDF